MTLERLEYLAERCDQLARKCSDDVIAAKLRELAKDYREIATSMGCPTMRRPHAPD